MNAYYVRLTKSNLSDMWGLIYTLIQSGMECLNAESEEIWKIGGPDANPVIKLNQLSVY